MIEELLRERFTLDYALNTTEVIVPLTIYCDTFILSDSKTCAECKGSRPGRENCNKETLWIEVAKGETVTTVNFEEYLNQFGDKLDKYKMQRCDYIILDDSESHRKFAFCDLTCSEQKYVDGKEGKRAEAFKQMKVSLDSLLKVDVLNQYILTYRDKVFLFGWREFTIPDITLKRNDSLSSIGVFLKTPSAESQTLEYTPQKGFTPIQVKYPAKYIW